MPFEGLIATKDQVSAELRQDHLPEATKDAILAEMLGRVLSIKIGKD
ncbi:MAG: hypothetical protein QXX41_01560 [Nitrososphaerota archaeon]